MAVPALKVLVCAHAPDHAGAAPPAPAQRHQAGMLLRTLLDDLDQVPGIALLPCPAPGPSQRRIDVSLQAADAVWPLAPQGGGMLERLSRQVLRQERILLGSQPHALRVAASRLRTSRVLARAGIDVVPTYVPGQPLPPSRGAWMVKPDDGADVDDTRIFSSAAAALAWISARTRVRYVLQPFLPGKLGSLALLCRDGKAQLLGCNEHRIAARDNQFHFLGTTVNSLADTDGAFARLAQAVAAALPGLWGHAAIDFVLAERGVVVLAVHARMTASYAGLRASLGCNPAALVLDLLAPSASIPNLRDKAVAVSVDVAAFGGR
jgi:predicted ATP-grasp superfamily ATP-dependent carboligase